MPNPYTMFISLNSDVVLKSQINGLQSFGPYRGETTINIITSSIMYNEFLMIGLHGTESILTSVIHNETKATVKDYGRAGEITAENLNNHKISIHISKDTAARIISVYPCSIS